MKNLTIYIFALIILTGEYSCKDDKALPEISTGIISPEFENDLLFVNQNNFRILTDKPATFTSTDPLIRLSADGVIERLTSGEVVPVDITWQDGSGTLRIYALGATDDNHDEPYASYHGKSATDAFNAYRQGWQTLRQLPAQGQSYGIILRHGDADAGKDFTAAFPSRNEPANWWKSCDPAMARQLNEKGKARSSELGKIFKDLNFPVTKVISSEFCRSVATAELINAGPPIEKDGRINHPEHNTSGQGLFQGLVEIMKEQPANNSMTLVVTHHPVNEMNSQDYPSFPLTSPFTWTGAYLVSISPDKVLSYKGAVSFSMFNYWRNLKLKRL